MASWSEKEISYIQSLQGKKIELYEAANYLNRPASQVVSKIYKMLGVDLRHSLVGSRRRAQNKWNNLVHRVSHTEMRRNKRYEGIRILVSKEAFMAWFMERDFVGASVDRIDKDKDYELSNMQVIPNADNIRKDKIKAVDGKCECYLCKQVKPLHEFAKDKRRANGYSTLCRICDNKRRRRTGSTGTR